MTALSVRSYDARGILSGDVPSVAEAVARQAATKVRIDSCLASAVVLQLSTEQYLVVYVLHHLACDKHSLMTLDRQLTGSADVRVDPYEDAVAATWSFLDRPETQASVERWYDVRGRFGPSRLYEASSATQSLQCQHSLALNVTDESLRAREVKYGDHFTESAGSAIAAFVGSDIVAETVHNGRAVATGGRALIVQGSARLASSVGMFATTGFRHFRPGQMAAKVESSLDALVAGVLERKRELLGESAFTGAWLWVNQVEAPQLVIDRDSLTEREFLPGGPTGLGLERDFADVGAGCALVLRVASGGVQMELTYSERYLSQGDARSMMKGLRSAMSG